MMSRNLVEEYELGLEDDGAAIAGFFVINTGTERSPFPAFEGAISAAKPDQKDGEYVWRRPISWLRI